MAEEEEEAPAAAPPASDQVEKSAEAAPGSFSSSGITLKKSSSRDYSRVMCETLTYTSSEELAEQKKLSSARIERQGSIRNTNSGSTSSRYVPPSSKRGYLSHHLLGCFPSRSRRSSLHLIPKLVLADEINRSGAVAVAAVSGFRCGSSKGGPAFSRVPADAARGSYSEPTSPQVTCIGQVKASRSKQAGNKNGKCPSSSKCPNSKLPPVNPNSSGCIRNSVLLRSTSNTRRGSVSSPLSSSSPARGFARSNSRRRDGEDDVLANVSASFEIDLTRDSSSEEPEAAKAPPPPPRPPANESTGEASDDEGEEESSRESPDTATLEQHRRLAIEVCQALAAAAAADPGTSSSGNVAAGSSEEEQDSLDQYQQEQRQDSHTKPSAAAAAALKRLDSINDSSPRACLWMRRSIARPIALDLTRKHRAARA